MIFQIKFGWIMIFRIQPIMSFEFFEDVLLQTDKLPDEFIEYITNFSTDAPESEIKSVLEHEKYTKHLIQILSVTESFSTIKAILDFAIISLQLVPSLAMTYVTTKELIEALNNHIKNKEIDLEIKFSICVFINTVLSGKRKQLDERTVASLDDLFDSITAIVDRENDEKYHKSNMGALISIFAQTRHEELLDKICTCDNARDIMDSFVMVVNRPGENNLSVQAVMGFLRGILKQKLADKFIYTNDFGLLIDVIYREVQNLGQMASGIDDTMVEYCMTLVILIQSPLWEEYEHYGEDKLKVLMKSVFSNKQVSIKSRAEAKKVYEELTSFE
jgi:hypothetical protein